MTSGCDFMSQVSHMDVKKFIIMFLETIEVKVYCLTVRFCLLLW